MVPFEWIWLDPPSTLRKMIGQANLTHDELLMTVVEIEAVINSRPLSYTSATDFEEPLTPSHLVVGRWLLNLPLITWGIWMSCVILMTRILKSTLVS